MQLQSVSFTFDVMSIPVKAVRRLLLDSSSALQARQEACLLASIVL